MSVEMAESSLVGTQARIWPYVRGVYGRDTLYRLWRVVESCHAGDSLFWGVHASADIHGDLVSFVKYFDEPGRYLLIVTNHAGDEIAGCVWFDDLVPQYRCFGSIFIHPKYRGPFSEEVMDLILRYAFETLEMQAVWGVTPWLAATALCLRCGFSVVAELPEFTKLNGKERSATVVRISKESFYGQHI